MLHLFVLAISMAGLVRTTEARAMDPLPVPDPAPEPAPPAVVGKTEVKIGNPQYVGNPPTSASVPITMELDSTTKGFIDIQVVVTDTRPLKGGNVPAGLTLAAPPQPGKGPVTINANFPVQKGIEYRIEARMQYTNAMNMPASTPDTKKITP
jgi:hypothetical protein